VLGRNVRGTPWRIGIKDPRRADGLAAVLTLDDRSAVTSGDYCRYFEEGGQRWHHILDPRTGYPARENLSVTVITRDAGFADVLSTAFFVLPAEQALVAAQQFPDVELVLITADGRLLHTPGLRERIEVRAGTAYRYDQG
jgi:thiamine biosynthesis lipoprotein